MADSPTFSHVSDVDHVQLDPKWAKLQPAVEVLIMECEDFCVILDHELDVDWCTTPEYDKVLDEKKVRVGDVSNRVSVLHAIPIVALSYSVQLAYRRIIGEAMTRALEGDPSSGLAVLDQAEKFVTSRNAELARRWYLTASGLATLTVLLLAGIGWIFFELKSPQSDLPMSIIAIGYGGALGAFLSILLRVGNAALDPAAGRELHYMEAGCRILTGVIGALIVLVAIKGNLVLPQLREPYGLFAACLAGGASERFGWSLIDNVATSGAESLNRDRVSQSNTGQGK